MRKHNIGDYIRPTGHPGIVCLEPEALAVPEASELLPYLVAELTRQNYQRLLVLHIDLRDTKTVALLESLDFRRRQEMHCFEADLSAERLAVPATPGGIEVTDLGAVTTAELYPCVEEAFTEHPIVGDEAQLDEVITDPNVLSDCSSAAWFDGRIIGFLIARHGEGDVADFAYLGVVPAWRRRGIGVALALLSFEATHQAGFRQATAKALPSNVAVAGLLPQVHFTRVSSEFNFSLKLVEGRY